MCSPARVVNGEASFEACPADFRKPLKQVHTLGGGELLVESANCPKSVASYHLKLAARRPDAEDVVGEQELQAEHSEKDDVGPRSLFRDNFVLHGQGNQSFVRSKCLFGGLKEAIDVGDDDIGIKK